MCLLKVLIFRTSPTGFMNKFRVSTVIFGLTLKGLKQISKKILEKYSNIYSGITITLHFIDCYNLQRVFYFAIPIIQLFIIKAIIDKLLWRAIGLNAFVNIIPIVTYSYEDEYYCWINLRNPVSDNIQKMFERENDDQKRS